MPTSISIRNIDNELLKISVAMRKESEKKIRRIVDRMVSHLVIVTPIDTGYARESWRVEETGKKNLPFRVENDAEYIQRLNEGSSKQAPPYFIERVAIQYGKPVGHIVRTKDILDASKF